MSSEGLSALDKSNDMSSEGFAVQVHPVKYNSLLRIKMANKCSFLKFELWSSVAD